MPARHRGAAAARLRAAVVEALEGRRLLASGDLDTTFGGGDGIVETNLGEAGEYARAVTIARDGDILVGGYDDGAFLFARYSSDGTIQAWRRSEATGSPATAVVEQPDGRILIGGSSVGTAHDHAIYRYTAGIDGDTSWGGDGVVTSADLDGLHAMKLRPTDGHIVAVGGTNAFKVAVYTETGSPDTSFSGDGLASVTFGDEWAVRGGGGRDVVVLPDGSILVAGNLINRTNSDRAVGVAKLTPGGALDTSFGGDGLARVLVSDYSDFDALAVDSHGRVLVAGKQQYTWSVVRLLANGGVDPSFGGYGDGIAAASATQAEPSGVEVLALPSGKILLVGTDDDSDVSETRSAFAQVRFTPGGSPDPTFGPPEEDAYDGEGAVVTGDTAYAWAAAMQADGKVVVVGGGPGRNHLYQSSPTNLFLARFHGEPADGPVNPQQPYRPHAVSPTTPLTIQAEDYDAGGEGVAYHDTDAANTGGGFRTTEAVDLKWMWPDDGPGYRLSGGKAGEWLEYTIDVQATDQYDLALRVGNDSSGGRVHVEVDGVDVSESLVVPSTGGFDSFQFVTVRGVTLTQGRHVLRLALDANASKGYAASVNYIRVEGTPDEPVGQQPFHGTPYRIVRDSPQHAVIIQAEDFDTGGEGVAYHDTDARNSGGANYRPGEGVDIAPFTATNYRISGGKAGEWLEYTVDVVDAGIYGFAIDVANDSAGGRLHMEVDGVDVTGPLVVPDTGGFDAFRFTYKNVVRLNAGVHVLRLALDVNAAGGYAASVNRISVFPSSDAQGAYPEDGPFRVGPAAPVTIQAEYYDTGGEGVAYHDREPERFGNSSFRSTEGVDISTLTTDGGGYRISAARADEWLEYTIDVAETNFYDLDLRLSNVAAGGRVHVEVDGDDVTGSLVVPDTNSYNTFATVTKSDVWLEAGRHVLRLALDSESGDGFVAGVNWLRITAAAGAVQQPFTGTPIAVSSTGPTTIQAEHYDTGGEGVAYHDHEPERFGGSSYRSGDGVDIADLSGGGRRISAARAGEWLEYTIDVAEAGYYDLDFRVSNVATGGVVFATIDGTDISGLVNVPDTNSYNTFATVTRPNVRLAAGQQVLRLGLFRESSDGFVAGVDWLRLQPAQQHPYRARSLTTAAPLTIQAEEYDTGGEGVAYHDREAERFGNSSYRPDEGVDVTAISTDGGGYRLGAVRAGEWLEYTFDVADQAFYRLDLRLSGIEPGGRVLAQMDGVDVTGSLAVPDTGSYNTFATVTSSAFHLSAGRHVLRLNMVSESGDGFVGGVNWLRLVASS